MNANAGKSADVVIIGAGAVGAAIAYELSKRGASVIVLDSGKDIGNGCSYANAGLLAPSHVEPLATPANVAAGMRYMFSPASPFYVRPSPQLVPWFARFVASSGPRRAQALTARMRELAAHSLHLHEEYAADGLPTGFRKSGSMDVFLTEKQFERAASALGSRESASGPGSYDVLSAAEAHELEPTLGEAAGAIYRPEEAQCGSQEFVRAALAAAEQHGARVLWDTWVHELPLRGGQIAAADTSQGRFTAETYIIAAGLGSEQLCKRVGIKMPMAGAKGYVVDLALDGSSPHIPLSFKELKVVATPYRDRLRLCGTLELGSNPRAMSAPRIQAIRDAGQRGLPGLKVQSTLQTWAGQRPCTADGVPSLGRSVSRPNLVVTAGHGMWGLVLAPVTGELVAQGIVEQAPTLHEAAFAPDRFGSTRRFMLKEDEEGRTA